MTASDFVVVYLTGGDAGDAKAALATDCTGCGRFGDRPPYEWAALVQPSRIDELLSWTGAAQVYGPVPWDGRPFGDGNGGTVEWPEGASAPEGEGMYEQAWLAAGRCTCGAPTPCPEGDAKRGWEAGRLADPEALAPASASECWAYGFIEGQQDEAMAGVFADFERTRIQNPLAGTVRR